MFDGLADSFVPDDVLFWRLDAFHPRAVAHMAYDSADKTICGRAMDRYELDFGQIITMIHGYPLLYDSYGSASFLRYVCLKCFMKYLAQKQKELSPQS